MLSRCPRHAVALCAALACALLSLLALGAPAASHGAPAASGSAPASVEPLESAAPEASSAPIPEDPLPAPPAAPNRPREAAAAPASASAAAVEAAAGPPAAPSAAPSASARAVAGVPVKLHDVTVFTIRSDEGGLRAAERARRATDALREAAANASPDDVRIVNQPGVAVVFAGKNPVVQLFPGDAAAAGDSSLEIHAASIGIKIAEAIRSEQQRSAIAKTVLSLSFVVVLALLALFLMRKFGELGERAQRWLEEHPDRVPAIRLKSLEVVRPQALRSGVQVAVGFGKWVAQIGVVYLCVALALSLFESTRSYTEKLTGFVLAPLSGLAGRVASALPVVIVAGIAAVALLLLIRFVRLFFASVASGETELAWLTPELAPATSVIVRAALVVAALVFAAPVVTGDPNGALTRAGVAAIIAVGLASTPLLASAVVGCAVLYSRRLRVGELVELGHRAGKVVRVGLLDVCLAEEDGCLVRVPHLLALVHPTRIIGKSRCATALITTADAGSAERARGVLREALGQLGEDARLELVALDADGAHFRVSARGHTSDELMLVAVRALERAGLTLGRSRP
ncbi:MAG: mechanosensitive ion channel family protein [Sorangiineae bacterium]|nr:mechanosensitive ion channel family protein [Polyangiaceae bacterium]MEB2322220.1 mechanosensitive ion channel family protein [Sorangiineae bacterium]